MTDRRILLGRITGAHGIRGEVVVRSHTGDPAAIGDYGPVSNDAGTRSFELRVLRATPKGIIARIAGIADRNAAEALKGTDLYVARSQLPPAEEGEFYHADLIGLVAVAPDGTAVGTVVAMHNFGAGDLLEIRLASTHRTEFIPFTEAFAPTVDLAAGRITVRMPETAGGESGSPQPPAGDDGTDTVDPRAASD